MKLLMMLLLIAGFCSADQDTVPYLKAVQTLENNYEKQKKDYNDMVKAPRYHWEFLEYRRYPYGCTNFDFKNDSSEVIYLWDYGFIVGRLKGTKIRIQIAVLSYIKKDEIPVRTLVYRMHFFELNTKGAWFEYQLPHKTTHEWNGEMYICGN